MAGDQLGDVGVDRHQLHADADAGDEAPQVDAEAGGLERHDQRAGAVPEQREGEDEAAAVGVGDPAERHGADPQAGEQREHEGARAGHLERRQNAEDAERLRGEQARLGHAGDDVGGQEQVVELEAGAERDQDDQVPDVAAAAGRRSSRAASSAAVGVGILDCPPVTGVGGIDQAGDAAMTKLRQATPRSGLRCSRRRQRSRVGAALQSEAAALKGRGCVAAGGGSAQGVSGAPLPNVQAAMVPRAKILSYLLDATHPGNGGKAAFFNPFGFTAQNWGILQSALQRRSWHASGRQGGDGCVGHEVPRFVAACEALTRAIRACDLFGRLTPPMPIRGW